MADDFSKLVFDQDLGAVLDLEESKRWKIERVGDLEIFVTASPAKAPAEVFQARFLWNTYPGEPPSYKYRDPETGRLDLTRAWPELPGYRPNSFDACVSWCAEGFAIHPEWKNDPNIRWNPKGNVLLKVLSYMQRDLDEKFVKRSP